MKAVLYNRILLILGFVGMFVAGVLSLAHAMNVSVPCGGSSDCDKVTNDPSSVWFHVIPVAYIGLATYVLLTTFAVVRSLRGAEFYRVTALWGYVIAAVGTLISVGLQFYSYFVIHAVCKWCFASAVTMTLTLVAYAIFYEAVSGSTDEAIDTAAQQARWDWMLSPALTVVLLLGLVVQGNGLSHSDRIKPLVVDPKTLLKFPLVPKNPDIYGSASAPVTIVEFADLNCPGCQQSSPKVKEYVREHEGKIRLIYRHLPLTHAAGHETSEIAAAIDEYASEKGKFWEYTMAVMGTHQEIKEVEQLFTIASSINLDVNDLKKRLENENDPLYTRLTQDKNTANALGLSTTPTFILMGAPGTPPQALGYSDLMDALGRSPYKKLMDGA